MRFRRFPLLLTLVCLLAGPGRAEPETPRQTLAPIPTADERDEVLGIHATSPERRDPRQLPSLASQELFDATEYRVVIDFDDEAQSIDGSVRMTAVSLVASLQQIQLDLLDNMTVTQVREGLLTIPYTHQNDLLTITLPVPAGLDESFTIEIDYHGEPQPGGLGTFGWNKYAGGGGLGEAVWSLSEPNGARHWWPCKDRPDDKALVETWWTVRNDWIATGNGVLLGVDDVAGNRKRFRWRATHPLTTYLVSVAASNYAAFSHTYTPLAGGSMPIDYFVYPEDLADAQVSFQNTAAMLEFFAETFGEYPFVEDKYGMAAFPFGGAMEHSTNSSYGYQLIDGTLRFDYVNAHEIAHQWWGDSISPETWPDIWLNEGFASYSEALWTEHQSGAAAYRNYMQSMFRNSFSGPVYDPISLFSSTVYNKGGWVMHMLRGVMGDTAFFDSLRQWYTNKFNGVGNTAEFQANQEALHGAPLDWFFDRWVYGTGRPSYQFGYSTVNAGGGLWRTYVQIVQTGADVFTMPVQLTLEGAGIVETVWNDTADQFFVLETDAPVTGVLFDEANWILKTPVTEITLDDGDGDGVPDGSDNCPAQANPDQSDADGDLLGNPCDDDDDGDTIPDGQDCAPLDAGQGVPSEVASLQVAAGPGATTLLAWSAADRADSYDLGRGALDQLGSGYGSCLATGLVALGYDETQTPAPGAGFLYLVRGVDGGCGGPGGFGASSSGADRAVSCP